MNLSLLLPYFSSATSIQVLEAMGQAPTEDELFEMISEVDDNMSGSIDFGEFLKVGSLFQVLDASAPFVHRFVNLGGRVAQEPVGEPRRRERLTRRLRRVRGQRGQVWLREGERVWPTSLPPSLNLTRTFFQKDTMIHIIKYDFGLTINIEELINKIDTDGSGEIEYDEFELLLGN